MTTNYLINNVSEYYYRYAVAGKTGYTDAGGRCVAALAERDGISYYCVILGGSGEGRADLRETTKLFKWAFSEFDFKTVVEKNEPIVGVDAAGNTIGGVEVGLFLADRLYAALRRRHGGGADAQRRRPFLHNV